VYESGGHSISVSDEAIFEAQSDLALKHGVFVEPAGAAAWAGYQATNEGGTCVVLATGSGLKTDARTARSLAIVDVTELDEHWESREPSEETTAGHP
jgi:threonine synthase